MLPSHHALAASAVAAPLVRGGWNWRAAAVFAVASVGIDVDHYFWYVWHTGDLSLSRAYLYHRNKLPRRRRWRLRPRWPPFGFVSGRTFHATPVLLGLVLAAWLWRPLRPVAAGFVFHRLLDEAWSWLE